MSMYDDIKVLYPLPDPQHNLLSYQTKDLDCNLDQYEVRKDKSLWLIEESGYTDEGEFMYSFSRKVDHTGAVSIYTHLDPPDGYNAKRAGWLEYILKFKEGILVNIEIDHLKPPTPLITSSTPEP